MKKVLLVKKESKQDIDKLKVFSSKRQITLESAISQSKPISSTRGRNLLLI
jgi:hypothetical protein